MSNKRRLMAWDELVDHLREVKLAKPTQKPPSDSVSDTSSKASKHSETSRYNVTGQERTTIRNLDHNRCFVRNGYCAHSEVAHVVDNCNAGNRELVESLRGLGVVHPNFNLADISNLILMGRDMHFLWDKHAIFVIVPSQATRAEMIDIVSKDRSRARFAARNQEIVYPCQLAYPDNITYDIIFFQSSNLGSPGHHFSRTDDDVRAHYIIPKQSLNLDERLGYLQKLDDDSQHRELLGIHHVTGRTERQAINPYLMVMNATKKLRYWDGRLCLTSRDPVFEVALQDCQTIMKLLSKTTGANICMSMSKHDDQTQGSKEDDIASNKKDGENDAESDGEEDGEKDGEKTSRSSRISSRNSVTELKSPGDTDFHISPMTSWISRGDFDKATYMESWRQEVSELKVVVPDQQGLVGPKEAPFAGGSRQICQRLWFFDSFGSI